MQKIKDYIGKPNILIVVFILLIFLARFIVWPEKKEASKASYLGMEESGIENFSFNSSYYNIYDSQVLRILRPNEPALKMEHNFLFILPVEKKGVVIKENMYLGNAIEIMQKLNIHNKYNLTIIEPSFEITPWYANHPTNKKYQYESFMVSELAPWVRNNLATSGHEQNWLIGYSKSGYGAMQLIFKHPDVFDLVAAWDFPATNMSSFDQFANGENFGTDKNFQKNYRLTDGFIEVNKAPFLKENRIWISGFCNFSEDVKNFDKVLSQKDIKHTLFPQEENVHSWDSAWLSQALEGLHKNSINLQKLNND